MPHPLVIQLRFARSEFRRGLEGLTAEEAKRRIEPMNSISWNVGHFAWQEQRNWLTRAQGDTPLPELNERFAFRAPASTPELDEVWKAWSSVTKAADRWLDVVNTTILQSSVLVDGKSTGFIYGSLLYRMIYHYWYHTGENAAIRQQLGHSGLPDFVGDVEGEAPYRAETDP